MLFVIEAGCSHFLSEDDYIWRALQLPVLMCPHLSGRNSCLNFIDDEHNISLQHTVTTYRLRLVMYTSVLTALMPFLIVASQLI